MRRITLAVLALLVLAIPAIAQTNEVCQQTDGQWGVLNGTTGDDAGCITPSEYEQAFSVDNLLSEGIIVSAVPNGDGTVTVEYALGGIGILVADPLERPAAANTNPSSPAFEPDSPSVGEALFGPVLHPGTGGPQEF